MGERKSANKYRRQSNLYHSHAVMPGLWRELWAEISSRLVKPATVDRHEILPQSWPAFSACRRARRSGRKPGNWSPRCLQDAGSLGLSVTGAAVLADGRATSSQRPSLILVT